MSDTASNDGSGGRSFGRARTGATSVTTARGGGGVRMSKTTVLRIFVLLLAAASGYGAIQIAGNVQEPAPVSAALPVAAPPPIETEDVLVANGDLPLGKVITADDVTWVAWPKKIVSEQAMRRSVTPALREELVGSLVRSPLIKGEPVRGEKLVKATGSGILAAMLPSGYRGMAINIDSQGGTTAGGFILPNDRVDVLRTVQRSDPARPEGEIKTETLLTNVRVLAIGQNIQERNGERVVTGSNATLEVSPPQAELLAQAQRSGQISLSLRSMADSGPRPSTVNGGSAARPSGQSMLTVGVLRSGRRQEYSVPEVVN